uniref:60S ribosomal protein L7a n=1 Tax=Cebus imitator TaxID=2715852 RepID=A0A2K5S197_CEBIM
GSPLLYYQDLHHCRIQPRVNTVTALVENKKAQLVVIANAFFQLVVFLPALCQKMGVPYCTIKAKARLGRLIHRKTCTTVAFTQVNEEDKGALAELVGADEVRAASHKILSCNVLGPKSGSHRQAWKKERPKELESDLG